MADPLASSVAPMPLAVEPMLASIGRLPADLSDWALEIKWDGVRAVTFLGSAGAGAGAGPGPGPREVRALGRRGIPIHDRYPELAGLGPLLPGHDAVLDGEVVAFEDGRPSFERLQRRMHVSAPPARLMREVPIRYVVFDLLYLDGHPLLDLPYAQRRELLDGLELNGGSIETPPCLLSPDPEQAAALLEFTRERRLEGVMAKRLDSPYRPGRRVDFWIKAKHFRTQEVVVAGWKPGKGRRAGGVGSLLLGVHDRSGGQDPHDGTGTRGRLLFAGHVGTGFTDRALDEIAGLLAPLARPSSPFDGEVPREYARHARWVEPRLVGEVAHGGWTQEGRLRTPSWRGLRDDRAPEEVIREP